MFIADDEDGTSRRQRPSAAAADAVPDVGALNDDDIKSLFAYLQSLPPVKNSVPQPIDPPEGQQ